MPLWLGKPGTLLTELRSPTASVERSPTGHEAEHELLAGGYAVDRTPNVCRRWQMDWVWDDTVWWTLYAFYSGQYGWGPYAMYDEAAINVLSPNQASGTEAGVDATGFTCDPSETVASSTTFAYSASRSLKWSLPASVTSGILAVAAPSSLYGWPSPSTAWTFSAWIRTGASGDTSVTVGLALRWLDSAGAQISETLGATATISTTWVQLTVTGHLPAGAVYAVPRVKVTAASVSGLLDLHLDQTQLQLADVVTDWRPGEGLPLVSMVKPKEVATLTQPGADHRRNIGIQFTQVGAG